MGFSGISPLSLLLILLIILVLFGAKRLSNIGQDLGAAIKSFRKGLEEKPESSAMEAENPEKKE